MSFRPLSFLLFKNWTRWSGFQTVGSHLLFTVEKPENLPGFRMARPFEIQN
jgi:hypothetical protein